MRKSCESTATLVANYVGTSYDVVKEVADNLAAISSVASSLDTVNSFIGSATDDPLTRANGDPLQEGDLYYNSIINALKVYTAGSWVTMTNSVVPTLDTFTGDGVTTDFTLSNTVEDELALEIHIQGIYQEKSAYTVAGTTLSFSEPPEDGHSIEVVIGSSESIITGASVETVTLTSGQVDVSFTNNVAVAAVHISGQDVDGRRLIEGEDFSRDSVSNTVSLQNSYPAGTKISLIYTDEISAPFNANQAFMSRESFVGDGVTTDYPLTTDTISGGINTIVSIDGVLQNISGYSSANSTLTFSTAPPLYSAIEIIQISVTPMPSTVAAQTSVITLTAGQTQATYTNPLDRSAFFIRGANADSGRLVVNQDYTLDLATKTINLSESYPAGTLLVQSYYDSSSNVFDNGTVVWTSGAGTPEGVVTASVGSMYTRTDGGASTTLYVKETGTGNTGWVAK